MLKNVTNWYGDGKQETYAPYDRNEETILFVFRKHHGIKQQHCISESSFFFHLYLIACIL
jgi:hypothetical protein